MFAAATIAELNATPHAIQTGVNGNSTWHYLRPSVTDITGNLAAVTDQIEAILEDVRIGWEQGDGTPFFEHFLDTGFARTKLRASANARDRAPRAVADGRLRLLIEGGAPVAMAGMNAEVDGIVQLGSVHVPRDRRNRGLGRRVTAALLAEQRARGIHRAVLFANNAAAARAYEAIGFGQVGSYRIALLDTPRAVGVAA